MTQPNLWQRLAAHQWERERRYVFNACYFIDAIMWLLCGRTNYCMYMWLEWQLGRKE